jgi:hypothetical protein
VDTEGSLDKGISQKAFRSVFGGDILDAGGSGESGYVDIWQ